MRRISLPPSRRCSVWASIFSLTPAPRTFKASVSPATTTVRRRHPHARVHFSHSTQGIRDQELRAKSRKKSTFFNGKRTSSAPQKSKASSRESKSLSTTTASQPISSSEQKRSRPRLARRQAWCPSTAMEMAGLGAAGENDRPGYVMRSHQARTSRISRPKAIPLGGQRLRSGRQGISIATEAAILGLGWAPSPGGLKQHLKQA